MACAQDGTGRRAHLSAVAVQASRSASVSPAPAPSCAAAMREEAGARRPRGVAVDQIGRGEHGRGRELRIQAATDERPEADHRASASGPGLPSGRRLRGQGPRPLEWRHEARLSRSISMPPAAATPVAKRTGVQSTRPEEGPVLECAPHRGLAHGRARGRMFRQKCELGRQSAPPPHPWPPGCRRRRRRCARTAVSPPPASGPSMRARAAVSSIASRATRRRSCSPPSQSTTTSRSKRRCNPASTSRAASVTKTRPPAAAWAAARRASSSRTRGCTRALSSARAAASANTRAPSTLRSTVPSAARIPRPNAADHVLVGGPAGRDHLVGHRVEVERPESGRGQMSPHARLAAGDAAGEADPQHRASAAGRGGAAAACSAEDTVLLMSMAMVSGPTPPGTGVSAPARSRTEGAWTSPTSR